MELYGYFRSSTAYRVRIALNVKGLDCTHISLSLLNDEHKGADYMSRNPQGLVPYMTDDDLGFGQSMAMLEYLEESYPQPALLPSDAAGRARIRQLSGIMACDIHPINNLRVLKYITDELGGSAEQKTAWYHHWIGEGFKAFETLLQDGKTGDFCHGDTVSFADLCLVPQVYNARRFNCPLDDFPSIIRITDNCNSLDAFIHALPEKQRDAL